MKSCAINEIQDGEVKSILITGGGGFVGTHLLRALLADSSVEKICVLDKTRPSISSPKIFYLACDIRKSIKFRPERKFDICFHLAAVCREPGFEWNEYFEGNYLGTRNLCDWAIQHKVKNIVFTSTSMVFGAGDNKYNEESLPNADTAYGISKALAEEVLRGWARSSDDHRLRIVRPGVIFGRGGGGNFARLHKALKFGIFVYIGRSSTVKSTIYVKDLVRLLVFAAHDQFPYDTYHGVYPESTKVKDVCDAFCKVFGWRRYVPTLPYYPMLFLASVFEVLSALGLKNPIHRRRIQKLYQSTDLSAPRLREVDFSLEFSLEDAILDWSSECAPESLY